METGPIIFKLQLTISSYDLTPLKVCANSPSIKYLSAGYPLMLNYSTNSFSYTPSILAKTIPDSSSISYLAAFIYSGCRFLLCLHHGA